MAPQNQIVPILVILSYIARFGYLGYCKVLVQKFENCEGNETYKVIFNSTFKTDGDKQYTNTTAILTAPVDNNLKVNVVVEMLVGKQYVYLFSFNEKKSCDALNKYCGEFWYDMERHAQVMPGLCPIAKGRYYLHNYLLNWGKMTTLQNFPFGNLRVSFTVYEPNNSVFTCFILEAANQM